MKLEAIAFAEEIKQLQVIDALPIARHFFSAYPELLKQYFSLLECCKNYWRRRQSSDC
jgi:hypothetical protein